MADVLTGVISSLLSPGEEMNTLLLCKGLNGGFFLNRGLHEHFIILCENSTLGVKQNINK